MMRVVLILNGFFEKSGEQTSVLIRFIGAIRFPILLIGFRQIDLGTKSQFSNLKNPRRFRQLAPVLGQLRWQIVLSAAPVLPAIHLPKLGQ